MENLLNNSGLHSNRGAKDQGAASKPAADESTREIIRGVADFAFPILLDPTIRLDHTIFVRAGAGSGKTSVLVERMLALVRSGIPLEKIVAITFTKKAAGELQERFFERLIRSRKEVESKRFQNLDSVVDVENHPLQRKAIEQAWEKECAILDRAVEDAEQVFIGTIHSFCARLLRLQSLTLGIPPEFEQIDDREEEKLRKTYWAKFINASAASGDADLAILQDAEVSFEALFYLFGTLSKNASAHFQLSGSLQPDVTATFERLANYIAEVSRRLPTGDPDDFSTEIERLGALMEAFDGSDPFVQLRILKTAARMVSGKERPSFGIKVTYWGSNKTESRIFANDLLKGQEDLGLGKSFLDFILEDVIPDVQSFDHWLHDRALSLCTRSVEEYRIHRLQSGKLTYDDLLAEALHLVRSVPTARKQFQTMFEHILVDEFQDTDPIQAAMLFTLASETLDASDWSSSTLIPGMLFLVGDDKQSIYRFRKADFQAFHLVGEAVQRQNGLDLKLTVNFRSDERICGWVNQSVGRLFGNSVFPYQAPWEDLSPHHKDLGYTPIIQFKVAKSPIRSLYPKIYGECVAIVRHLRQLISEDVHGRLDYGSFLILVRRHANIPAYVAALTQAGIPVGVSGGKAEKISEVLAWMDDLLKAVYDLNDGVSLVATLRGVFFGVSDQDLFDFVQNGGNLTTVIDAPLDIQLPERLRVAVALLHRIRELFLTLPPHQALEKVLAESGIEAMLRTQIDADVVSGMLQRILDLFREWEAKGTSFGRCVEEFGLYRTGTISLETFSDSVPYGSCVRIMTVHQAKGLQAPVVILADTGGKEPPDSTLHTYRKGPNVVGKAPLVRKNGFNSSVELEPAGWAEALNEERLFDAAERMRLLYVACTRAEFQLIISTNEEPKNGPWDDLSNYLSADLVEQVLVPPVMDIDEWFRLNPEPIPSVAPLDRLFPGLSTQENAQSELKAVKDQIEALSKPTWVVKRPSDKVLLIDAHERGVSVRTNNPENDGRRGLGRDIEHPDSSFGIGIEYGSAIHALFESLVSKRRENNDRDSIQTWAHRIMKSRFGNSPLESLTGDSVQAALAFYDSDLWTEIVQATRVLTEVPFTVTEVVDDLECVISGVVDLAYRNEKGWFVVDYKTDRATDEIMLGRHTSQLLAYRRAWNQIFTDETCTVSIWSTHLGRRLELRELDQ